MIFMLTLCLLIIIILFFHKIEIFVKKSSYRIYIILLGFAERADKSAKGVLTKGKPADSAGDPAADSAAAAAAGAAGAVAREAGAVAKAAAGEVATAAAEAAEGKAKNPAERKPP